MGRTQKKTYPPPGVYVHPGCGHNDKFFFGGIRVIMTDDVCTVNVYREKSFVPKNEKKYPDIFRKITFN